MPDYRKYQYRPTPGDKSLPENLQLYVTYQGPGDTPYPKPAANPNVYYAHRVWGTQFTPTVGRQELNAGLQDEADYYVFCDFAYLFEGTLVAVLNGLVISILSGSGPVEFYMTSAGTGGPAYPLPSTYPSVYPALRIERLQYPQTPGAEQITAVNVDDFTAYTVFCDFTYLFQGTYVAAIKGVVIGIVTGSRFEVGITGTLASALSSGGTATVSITFSDALGNTVTDTLTVLESMGLAAGTSLASGTSVYVEWDLGLFAWVVVATACGGSTKPTDTPRPRKNTDTPISIGD